MNAYIVCRLVNATTSRWGETDLHLCQHFENLTRVNGGKYVADCIQRIGSWRERDALGQMLKERVGIVTSTMPAVVSLAFMPFTVVAFTPLGACLAAVYDLATYRCLPLKERIRVCEINSQRSTTNFLPIEIADR